MTDIEPLAVVQRRVAGYRITALETDLANAQRTLESLENENQALRLENKRLRHDLLDAQTARQMAEAERDQVAAQLHEVRHIQRTLTPVDYT